MIGTPACYDMLTGELRIARRVTGSGEIIWNNMQNNKEFRIFMNGIWKNQYVINKAKLDEDMVNLFYEKTQGISDLVVKLFVNTQKVAIERNIETITKDLVEKVWDKEFKLLKPMINSISSNNKAKMFKYEDIRLLESSSIAKKNEVVQQNLSEEKVTIKELIQQKNKRKIKISELGEDDIRKIVMEGIKNGKNNYDSLLNSGVIVSVDNILGAI